MEVDVVVTTFNRTEYVDHAIQAIKGFIPHGKIIIVDGSTDPAAKRIIKNAASMFGAEYHEGPVAIGGKVYIGAKNARTEWILVCSDDTVVGENYWQAVLQVIGPRAGFIAPNAEHGFRFHWWRDFLYWFQQRPSVCAGSYVVRRKLVLECPELMGMNMSEDSYMRDHCVQRGYDFLPLAERVAFHDLLTPSEIQQRKRAWEYGRVYGQHPSKNTLRMMFKFTLAKVEQVVDYSRERGFSLPVALFQMFLVASMCCGTLNLWKPEGGRGLGSA